MAETLVIVRTPGQLEELEKYLKDKDIVAYDCETTGLDKGSEIIGFSVCVELDLAYYVVLSEWNVEHSRLDHTPLASLAGKFLKCLQGKRLILHNAVFDCAMAEDSYGVSLIESVFCDTMILAHLINENRAVGLKDLAVSIFGEDSKQEQTEMKASVLANGGALTKSNYELYKADSQLIGRYGAKDTILTLKLFYHLIPQLYEQGLDKFFFEDESMPLLRGPTYELNTTGLRVDTDRLAKLRGELEGGIMDAKAFIYKEITPSVKDKYPGDKKSNQFNIGSNHQLSWLLFVRLGEYFHTLTESGKQVCKFLNVKLPYTLALKREFIHECSINKGRVYELSKLNPKTGKMSRPKKIGDWWTYATAGKETLAKFADKYEWVKRFQTYNKDLKLLNTYVDGIQERMKYGIIRPSFLQHGTTSGRYSSRNPNFQNLPREDTRIKSCIIARPGNVFVGADFSQLEARVFASMSQDKALIESFKTGEDFYSVIGMRVFVKKDCTAHKEGSSEAFGVKYKALRNVAKVIALSATYGTTAPKMAPAIGKSIQECQEIIDDYFHSFPGVRRFQLESHEEAKTNGAVYNLFGRPRRMPEAMKIPKKAAHGDLTYEQRNLLNLAVNHRVQSTAATIMNRCSIKENQLRKELGWDKVKLLIQIHDEIVLECPEDMAEDVAAVLKCAMEDTCVLPGVALIAEPKIAKDLAGLK